MHRQPVTSSNITSIGYDPGEQTLEVEFKTGQVYQYYRVLPAVYQGLMSASSHGSFFSENVKGVYEYHRVGESRMGGHL